MTVTSVSLGPADSQWTTGDRGNYAGYSGLIPPALPVARLVMLTPAPRPSELPSLETGDMVLYRRPADRGTGALGRVQRLLEDGGIIRQRIHRSQADKCCNAHVFMIPDLSSIVAETSFPILKIP